MSITKVNVADEISESYVTYALSTLNRAIPDCIDGLKISQRRVIQAAFDLGLKNSKPYRKVSRLAGETSGVYSPHGDCSDTIVHMASHASFLHPLIDGHGNLGPFIMSGPKIGQVLSNDGHAASRYLECRLSAFAEDVFDIDAQHLDVVPTYDGQKLEIERFIPALPIALINQQTGIGTGYATSTAAYELKRLPKALKALQQGNRTGVASALGFPDFTCYSQLIKDEASLDIHVQARGTLSLVGAYSISDVTLPIKRNKHRKAFVVTELPKGSAESFMEQIAKGLDQGKIHDIAHIEDTSNGDGLCVTIILKHNANVAEIEKQLLRYTNLASKISINNTLLQGNMPKLLTPADILSAWYEARFNVLKRIYAYELELANKKYTRLIGLIQATSNIELAIKIILASDTTEQASLNLQSEFKLNEEQAKAILEISLKQLVKLEKDKLMAERDYLLAKQQELTKLMEDDQAIADIIYEQVKSLCSKYSMPRKTKLVAQAKLEPIQNEEPNMSYIGKALLKLNQLPKKLQGKPIGRIAQAIEDDLASLFEDRPSHAALNKFCAKYGVIPVGDKYYRANSKSQERFVKTHLLQCLKKRWYV